MGRSTVTTRTRPRTSVRTGLGPVPAGLSVSLMLFLRLITHRRRAREQYAWSGEDGAAVHEQAGAVDPNGSARDVLSLLHELFQPGLGEARAAGEVVGSGLAGSWSM